MVNLQVDEVMRLRVMLGEVKVVGTSRTGRLQVIPIIGGIIGGDKIKGKVVPGGADWNMTLADGREYVFAKYLLETDDGNSSPLRMKG